MPIEYEKHGKVVVITMNRPDAMNFNKDHDIVRVSVRDFEKKEINNL